MAKYAYAPVTDQRGAGGNTGNSTGGNRFGAGGGGFFGGGGGGGGTASNGTNNQQGNNEDEDQLIQERMPMCVGICVLLAIVYVLSRTGEQDTIMEQRNNGGYNSNNNNNNNSNDINNMGGTNLGHNVRSVIEPTSTANAAIPAGTAPSNTNGNNNNIHYNYNPDYNGYYHNNDNNNYYNNKSPQSSTVTVDTKSTTASSSSSVSSAKTPECDCPESTGTTDPNELMAKLRAEALAKTTPHIIECSAADAGQSQEACHLPPEQRFAALGQKGATLWMTGCSGSGKTTIATALEELLVKRYNKHVYRLDGDNLRTGLNRDLTFTESDRAESVRRTGELATLFSDAGVITLVGLISPYRADRDAVRRRHVDQGIPFYEVFLDVPIDELKARDPKGQYARVENGELKHFTCIDDPYEEPLTPEITLKTHELEIEDSVRILFRRLERDGILIGPPKVTPPGLPNPDGDLIVDLHVPPEQREAKVEYARTLPKVLINDIDLNWLQTIGEGWAAPLKGFMREGTLLETLHFNSILVDPFNVTGNALRLETHTDFNTFPEHPPTNRVSMPIPITLSCTSFTKQRMEESGKLDVALVTRMGHTVAILKDFEIYDNRKEEIVTRMFGVIDMDHPYIKTIYSGGDYLIGGEVELLDRIRYNDGLDKWRKSVQELLQEFSDKGADTVYAFQTRNPTHAGHAYLMKSAGEDLKTKGYQKPILWLSPLGGWTKSDDVPLDVRVRQHEEVLEAGTSHPGGLDPDTTVMAIWPAPMVYAGPTEVQFHAKSRRCAGASYFVVGRDPAGMKGSPNAVAHPDDDLYDGNHGRYVLQNSPGIGDMQMLSFVKVMYDVTDNVMKIPDESRMDDFISISGTKMRLLARNGAVPCSPTNIPTDLVAANCIPSGFMVPKGWNRVVDYYKNIADSTRWIPWSQPRVPPPVEVDMNGNLLNTHLEGTFGFSTFELSTTQYDSWWHDIPIRPEGQTATSSIINFVTEIPMYMAAKMEVDKTTSGNPIKQDLNKDDSPRYYTYGTPFFNYGLIPQTWEDPSLKTKSVTDGNMYGGDNDPIDVMEIGSRPLGMGSVTPCKVIGSLLLIDEGETDHKIICINVHDIDATRINSMDDLQRIKPGTLELLKDWLKRYKTSDGKDENALDNNGTPKTVLEALEVIEEVHQRWRTLCGLDGTRRSNLSDVHTEDFWLSSRSCRGTDNNNGYNG